MNIEELQVFASVLRRGSLLGDAPFFGVKSHAPACLEKSFSLGGRRAPRLQVRQIRRERVQIRADGAPSQEPCFDEHGAAPHEGVEHGLARRAQALDELSRRRRMEPSRIAVEAVHVVSARLIVVRDVERGLERGAKRGVAPSDLDATADMAERAPLTALGGRTFLENRGIRGSPSAGRQDPIAAEKRGLAGGGFTVG